MNKVRKPIIGISANILIDQGGKFPGYRRSYVNEDYVKAVVLSGGIPVILPITDDESVIASYIEKVDGLLLSGGYDIYPQNYGEEPLEKIGETLPERDAYEACLLQLAMHKKMPILGICRGLQMINVYQKGTLWQDLSYNKDISIKHTQAYSPTLPTHTVNIEKDSMLYDILKVESTLVNSFHHQIIREIGEDLKVVARAKDGAIEAVELKNYPFLLAVQWHPEMMHATSDIMLNIFKRFIEVSR